MCHGQGIVSTRLSLTLAIMNGHDLCACQQEINQVNGKPAATSTTVAREEISEPRQDGSSQPPEEKAKRRRKQSDSQ